jgi:hypothetical protein
VTRSKISNVLCVINLYFIDIGRRACYIVGWLRLEGDVMELFDVAVIEDVRCPRRIGPRRWARWVEADHIR